MAEKQASDAAFRLLLASSSIGCGAGTYGVPALMCVWRRANALCQVCARQASRDVLVVRPESVVIFSGVACAGCITWNQKETLSRCTAPTTWNVATTGGTPRRLAAKNVVIDDEKRFLEMAVDNALWPPSVTHIRFTERAVCKDKGANPKWAQSTFALAFQVCPSLQSLDCACAEQRIVVSALRAIATAEASSPLTKLCISYWWGDGPDLETTLCAVFLRTPSLTQMDLSAFTGSISNRSVTALADCCPQLTYLAIGGTAATVTAEGLIQIAEKCPLLRHLCLFENAVISDVGLSVIGARCPRLTHVSVAWSTHLASDASIGDVARGCRMLKRLEIDGMNAFSDVALYALGANCSMLVHYSGSENSTVTAAGFIALAAGCRNLRELHVKGCSGFNDAAALAVASHCRDLADITLDSTPVTDVGLSAIARRCPTLIRVMASGIGITNDALVALSASCPHLADLHICQAAGVSDVGVLELAQRCSRLVALGLNDIPRVTDASLVALAAHCLSLRVVLVQGTAVTGATIDAFVAADRNAVVNVAVSLDSAVTTADSQFVCDDRGVKKVLVYRRR